MNYRTYQHRLAYLRELILKGQLSSPNDLKRKFECSEKTIRNMINHLRDEGMEIEYSRSQKKYLVKNE